jgi:hypothetical protein
MDQRRSGEGVTGALGAELAVGDPAKLLVQNGEQGLSGTRRP